MVHGSIACPVCAEQIDLPVTAGERVYGHGSLTDTACIEVTVSGHRYADHMAGHRGDPAYARALRAHAQAMLARADRVEEAL